MKALALTICLLFTAQQSHAFGWFLVGVMVGSGDSSNSSSQQTVGDVNSKAFMEVQSCDRDIEDRDTAFIRTSIIVGFTENKNRKVVAVNTVGKYRTYCLWNTTMEKVKTKYFSKGTK